MWWGGNCTAYAWGRFHEIMGQTSDKSGCWLPTYNAEDWYKYVKGYQKGSTPKLGAVLCLKDGPYSGLGHVAIVEEISADGKTIKTSESGWHAYLFKYKTRTAPYWNPDGYIFQGFIYNPNGGPGASGLADGAGTVVDIAQSSVADPRQVFLAEAGKHIGKDGHEWVKSQVDIKTAPWCAATVCAVAKACGFADLVLPSKKFVAGELGKSVVQDFGGKYITGGEFVIPEPGDLLFLRDDLSRGTYWASHVGIVEFSNRTTVESIDGNWGGKYQRVRRSPADIGWYVRPDWAKAPGALTSLYESVSTRIDASFREVGYITSSGQPSITSTNIPLSVVNYTSTVAQIYASSLGLVSGGSTGAVDVSGLTGGAKTTISYLTTKGLSAAAAVGVAANIRAESNFNPAAVGDNGTSFGICQWHAGRGAAMKNYVGSNWATNLSGQLDFLIHELTTNYSSVYSVMKSAPNTLAGAKTVADVFVRKFEVPANVNAQSQTRQKYAEGYWNELVIG